MTNIYLWTCNLRSDSSQNQASSERKKKRHKNVVMFKKVFLWGENVPHGGLDAVNVGLTWLIHIHVYFFLKIIYRYFLLQKSDWSGKETKSSHVVSLLTHTQDGLYCIAQWIWCEAEDAFMKTLRVHKHLKERRHSRQETHLCMIYLGFYSELKDWRWDLRRNLRSLFSSSPAHQVGLKYTCVYIFEHLLCFKHLVDWQSARDIKSMTFLHTAQFSHLLLGPLIIHCEYSAINNK